MAAPIILGGGAASIGPVAGGTARGGDGVPAGGIRLVPRAGGGGGSASPQKPQRCAVGP
jgi:hypothetical protein